MLEPSQNDQLLFHRSNIKSNAPRKNAIRFFDTESNKKYPVVEDMFEGGGNGSFEIRRSGMFEGGGGGSQDDEDEYNGEDSYGDDGENGDTSSSEGTESD